VAVNIDSILAGCFQSTAAESYLGNPVLFQCLYGYAGNSHSYRDRFLTFTRRT